MEYIDIVPYGKVLKDRLEIGKKYNLLKELDGMWLPTQKCRENYFDFGRYLRGEIEKPKNRKVYNQRKAKQQQIQELISL